MHPKAMRDCTFRVQVQTSNYEVLCLVGNCPELGSWIHRGAVILTKVSEGMEGEVWSTTVSLPKLPVIEYRYFVCVVVDLPGFASEHSKELIVRRWETNINPRRIRLEDAGERPMEQFGFFDGKWKVENGWLTAESVVQLKFYNNPIQIWKRRFAEKHFCIKVTPVDLERRDSTINEDESTDDVPPEKNHLNWPLIEISVMNSDECEFTMQEQFGRVYFPNDFVIFQAQMLHPETIAYMVDFFLFDPALSTSDAVPEHIGFCYILPSVLRNTTGISLVPITGLKQQPIGQLTVEYLVVRPMKHDCDMRVSYAKYWRSGRPALEVGHRGAGNSYTLSPKHCATVRENTVASMKLAAEHGADYVEFDVQLSKDLVPVIYHDFFVCITMRKKRTAKEHDLLEIPVKDLTLAQLHMLKLYHVSAKNGEATNDIHMEEDENDESAPFPTLQRCLEELPLHVGFNVEIKATMQRKDGSCELSNPFELNMYLDKLLVALLQHAGERRVVISCFHPDICTMVRSKQNKYPVLFLTQGQTSKWPPYLDTRTTSIPMAVYYARSAGILGIDVHTEDILKDHSLVKACKEANLVMFCWGDDNNDPCVMNLMRELGLDGIIYDRINEFKMTKENVFLMESKARANISGYSSNSSLNSSASTNSAMDAS